MGIKDLLAGNRNPASDIKGRRYYQRAPFTIDLWNRWLVDFNRRQTCNTGRIEDFRQLVEAFNPTKED